MRAPYVLAGLVALLAAGALAAPAARRGRSRSPRAAPTGFQCGQLTVPLDPAGAAGGTLTLNIRRRAAASNPTNSAVIGLAGGPGQAAIPFAVEDRRQHRARARDPRPRRLRPARHGLVRRAALLRADVRRRSAPPPSARRAPSTGPPRASRTSRRSAQAAGYAKLVLYGTSYGTKVAEAYAAKYPQNVEALVLDSVVLPDGPGRLRPLDAQPRRARAAPALRHRRAAAGSRGDPRGDVAALVRHLERAPLRGPVVDGERPHRAPLARARSTCSTSCSRATSTRRCAPTSPPRCAARCAATSARSCASQERTDPRRRRRGRRHLGGAVRCDDVRGGQLPLGALRRSAYAGRRGHPRGARHSARPARAVRRAHRAARRRHPAVRRRGRTRRPRRRPPGRCRAVPTLILDGDADLRTPVTDARTLATRIPGAQVLEVPFVGHSVIGADPTGCAQGRSGRVLRRPSRSSRAPRRRRSSRRPASPPVRLSRVPGDGRARQTANAAAETLQDVAEVFLGIAADRRKAPRVGIRIGGLRGGTARGPRPASACAASSTSPACSSAASRRGRRRATTTVTVSGDAARARHRADRSPAGASSAGSAAARVTTRLPGAATAARAAASRRVARLGARVRRAVTASRGLR